MVTTAPDALWQGQPQLPLLFPGSALSPAEMASSAGITPALDPRPRHLCQPASASTCPSQPRCGAAGPGPVLGRGLPVRRPARKPLLQTRLLLVLLRSGLRPGPTSSPQLPWFRGFCLGPRKAQLSPVMFFSLSVWAAGWLQEGLAKAPPLGELGPAPCGDPLRGIPWIPGMWAARLKGWAGEVAFWAGTLLPLWFCCQRASSLLLSSRERDLRFHRVRPSVGLKAMPCCLHCLPLTGASGSSSGAWMETLGPMWLPPLT